MAVLVLDRDGVINEDSDNYIRQLSEWHPIPGSIEAIARLSRAGYRIAIATNQSGLGRGYFGLDELEEIHQYLCQLVEEQGGHIDGIFYCPHLPGAGCNCRKPATGLLKAIEQELEQPLNDCYFVGDSLKDLQAARACDMRPVLVATGKGQETIEKLASPDVDITQPADIPIYPDLATAAEAILHS